MPMTYILIKNLTLITLDRNIIKISAKVFVYARYIVYKMSKFTVSKILFAGVIRIIGKFRPPSVTSASYGFWMSGL